MGLGAVSIVDDLKSSFSFRPKLQSFLTRMRTSEGAFKMHAGGEEDIR